MSTAAGLLLVTLVAAPLAAYAQHCQTLEGVWNLSPDESRLGSGLSFNPYFAITAVKLTIHLGPSRITQQWVFTGPHLNRTTRYLFTAAGTRQSTQLAQPLDFEYSAIAAEWQNCTLIVNGFGLLYGRKVVTTETYVLSADGRDLTVLQSGESAISVTDRRLAFVRQP